MKGGKSLVILVSRLVRNLPYEAVDGLTALFPGLVAYVIDLYILCIILLIDIISAFTVSGGHTCFFFLHIIVSRII